MSEKSFGGGESAPPLVNSARYLDDQQVHLLLETARTRGDPWAERDHLLLAMLAYTGRRVGEVLKVELDHIKWGEQMIHFHISKKKMSNDKKNPTMRMKYIPTPLWELLKVYAAKLPEWQKYLFQSSHHVKPITDARVRQIFYDLCDRAGIPDFKQEANETQRKRPHPHTMRHSFSVSVVKKIKDPGGLRKLQQLLEHSSIGVTMFYLQYSDTDQKDLTEELYQ